MRRDFTFTSACSGMLRRLGVLALAAVMMPVLSLPIDTVAVAATKLPAIDAALAAQASDRVRRDWNPDAELIQISATTSDDGNADGTQSHTPIALLFRANGKGYQMTVSSYGTFVGAPAILPRSANAALPIQFISLKDALALARAKGFSQTGTLHPVMQSQTSPDGLQRIGWLFAAPGDPTSKQIFVSAEGHQVGSVQQLFGSLRQ